MKTHYNIWVKGVVQGVFFRKFTRNKAVELEITGFVRNLPDGRVYIEAEGEPEHMHLLVEWLKTNPGSSLVDDVRVVEHKMINHAVFIIK
jgi:acylphosphatase